MMKKMFSEKIIGSTCWDPTLPLCCPCSEYVTHSECLITQPGIGMGECSCVSGTYAGDTGQECIYRKITKF